MAFRGTNDFFGKHYFFRCFPSNIRRTYQCLFWSNKTFSRSSFFDCRSFLKSWKCGASIPVPLACETSSLPFELHLCWGNCQCNSWTEFSNAYRSSFGYVDAGHQSICFSHANGLPFRLSCHAGVVQRSYSCQREVFDSHVSRTVFPSTSLWGKHWRFAAPISFSLSTAVSDASRWVLDVLINFFVDLPELIPVALVSWFPVFSEKMEMRGIHPRSSRLRNERSTFWARSPLRKLVDKDVWSHSFVNAKVERSLLFHIVLKRFLSIRVINPCASHMPVAGLSDSATSLVGPRGAN